MTAHNRQATPVYRNSHLEIVSTELDTMFFRIQKTLQPLNAYDGVFMKSFLADIIAL